MTKTTREAIIDAAGQLITQTHSATVSLTQVADSLGITHATIYRYFDDKQGLWQAVAQDWFHQNIIAKISVSQTASRQQQLHDWLWGFANAKRNAYRQNPSMFALNTTYIDNDPRALKQVQQEAANQIDTIMGYHDPHHEQSNAILSAFAVFALPNFKEVWFDDDYTDRFERLWSLIAPGI